MQQSIGGALRHILLLASLFFFRLLSRRVQRPLEASPLRLQGRHRLRKLLHLLLRLLCSQGQLGGGADQGSLFGLQRGEELGLAEEVGSDLLQFGLEGLLLGGVLEWNMELIIFQAEK